MLYLRLSAVALLSLCAIVSWCHASRHKRSSWFFGPHYSKSHYYSGNIGHNYYQPAYSAKPPCNSRRQCYNYMLVFSIDGEPAERKPNPSRFRRHHYDAGIDKREMIAEGKRAAAFFLAEFGVNATCLPDVTYLAPRARLPQYSDVTFGYAVQSGRTAKLRLTMASRKDETQFYNVPVSVAYWSVTFGKDYKPTGRVKGVVSAGTTARFGSYLTDSCPHQSHYHHCNSMLSHDPRGRLFIRFSTRGLHPTGIIDDVLTHETWGRGAARGVMIADPVTGLEHGRTVLTFPESCDTGKKCYAEDRYRHNKYEGDKGWNIG